MLRSTMPAHSGNVLHRCVAAELTLLLFCGCRSAVMAVLLEAMCDRILSERHGEIVVEM